MNDDKVFDVSKPDKIKPDTTSRPVIVGHRPIVQDPMVSKPEPAAAMDMEPSKDAPKDEEPKLDKTDEHTGVTIQPTASSLSKPEPTEHQSAPDPASAHVPINTPEHHETVEPPVHHSEAPVETDKPDELDESNPLAAQALKSEQQQKAEAAAAAHNEAAQKLIESKQYNVVVGHFHHRKSSNKVLMFIVVLVLIGGAAAAYFLMA